MNKMEINFGLDNTFENKFKLIHFIPSVWFCMDKQCEDLGLKEYTLGIEFICFKLYVYVTLESE